MDDLSTTPGVADWLDRHDIRTVRIQVLALDSPDLAKYLSKDKFLSAIDKGIAFADTIYNVDLGGSYGFGWDLGSWRGEVADIIVVPDPATLVVDPRLDGLASAIGSFRLPDGSPAAVCGRSLLGREVSRLASSGYEPVVAVEIEATLFEGSLEENKANGFTQVVPLGRNKARMYMPDPSPLMPDYLDALTRRLDELGIVWEAWNDEAGSGQIEVNLAPSDALTAADRTVRTKIAMREVAADHDITVAFIAKWNEYEGGNGFHVNHSLWRDGRNVFATDQDVARTWMGGLMATLEPASSVFQPTVNAFRRVAEAAAGTRMVWGVGNKTAAIRLVDDTERSTRVEHRVPAADVNIYTAIAAILAGGRIGVENRIEPPPPVAEMAWGLPAGYPEMPASLPAAVDALRNDDLLRGALGDGFVEYWIGSRRWEWFDFHTSGGDPDQITPWELARYVPVV